MPFSVLRTWGLGLVGWAMLGIAAYCLWEWADGLDPAPVRVVLRDEATGEPQDLPNQRVQAQSDPAPRDRQGGWPYLATGLTLLVLSTSAGSLPFVLLPRLLGSNHPQLPPPARTKVLERPDGTKLHVEYFGNPSGPTLVFTHGWSMDRTSWSYLVETLDKKCQIVVWDLPGLGRSRQPSNRDFSIEKMARDLEAVVEIAGKGPIILVGHSIGGMITQTFCRLNPNLLGPRIVGIALVHTTYTNPLRTALAAGFLTAIERPILIPLNYLTIWLAPLAWLSNMQSYFSGSLHVMTRIASFSGSHTWGQLDYSAWLAAIASPAVVARGNLAMLAFDEQQELPKLEIPVLIVAGKHDRMTKAEASERIAELVPHARETEIKSGHLGLWERSDELTSLIAEFALAEFALHPGRTASAGRTVPSSPPSHAEQRS
jgi:pimeloyl-ACP methyl ester carboxylesterase